MSFAVTSSADRTQSLPASLSAFLCGCLGDDRSAATLLTPSASHPPLPPPGRRGGSIGRLEGVTKVLIRSHRVSCLARAKFYSKRRFGSLQSHKRPYFPLLTAFLPRKTRWNRFQNPMFLHESIPLSGSSDRCFNTWCQRDIGRPTGAMAPPAAPVKWMLVLVPGRCRQLDRWTDGSPRGGNGIGRIRRRPPRTRAIMPPVDPTRIEALDRAVDHGARDVYAFGNLAGSSAICCRQDDLRTFHQTRFGGPRASQPLDRHAFVHRQPTELGIGSPGAPPRCGATYCTSTCRMNH
jgi:hypothetical protein